MAATALPARSALEAPPEPGATRAPTYPSASKSWLPKSGRRVLGVPLGLKLAGANSIVIVTAIVTALSHGGLSNGDLPILVAALAISFAISTVLVVLALEPVRELERAGRRILAGELDARVEVSVLADRDVRQVATVMNNLLESLTHERERIRDLAVRVVAAHDDERAQVARELEDSTAQGFAALLYELRAEADGTQDAELRNRLERLIEMLGRSIEELRSVTSEVHPRVLTDLGIGPALQWLARGVRSRYGVAVETAVPGPGPRLSPPVSAALFAAAREAAECGGSTIDASRVRISLELSERCAQLVVEFDGQTLASPKRRQLTEGLRQRVGLVDGWVAVEQAVSGGTAAVVIIPITLA